MKRVYLAMTALAALAAAPLQVQLAQPRVSATMPAGTNASDAAVTAEADALAALFPASLQWQHIEGSATELRTRHGMLSIVQGERCPNTGEPIFFSELRLDGEPVETLGCTRNGDYYIVHFQNAFELGSRDVVVLGASAGGSGSPPQRLHLIVLDAQIGTRVERDPAFRSIDGTERAATDGEYLWFDLGYDGGLRKTATYDGTALRIAHRPIAATPLAGPQCEAVHRTLLDCAQRNRNRDLTDLTASDFVDAPWSMSTASRRSLRELLERPGFRAEAYMQVCRLAAETGEASDYTDFAESVCAR